MNYAPFTPLPPTPSEQLKKKLDQKELENNKKELIKNMKLIELKSDYLGMTTYYYSKYMNEILGIEYDSAVPHKVSFEEDKHLRQLNNLPPASQQ